MSKPHALRASRLALEDAKKAFKLFRGKEGIDFRLAWVLNLNYTNIVKEVLLNVDKRNADARVKNIIADVLNSHYFFDKNKCDDEVKVIRELRRMMHHFYEMQYQGEDVYEYGIYEEDVFEGIEITEGPFKGLHPIGVIERTLDWWERILDEIEAAAASP